MDLVSNEFVAHRAFHLVVKHFNKYISSVLLLFLVTSGTSQIISVALLVHQTKSDLKIPIPLNLFFIAAAFETMLIIMIVYGFPGELYQKSKKSLDKLKTKVLHNFKSSHKRKFYIRFLDSCQVSKIRFGLSNFIEKTTPPIFQLFCADRIIDVLLTQSKS